VTVLHILGPWAIFLVGPLMIMELDGIYLHLHKNKEGDIGERGPPNHGAGHLHGMPSTLAPSLTVLWVKVGYTNNQLHSLRKNKCIILFIMFIMRGLKHETQDE